VEYIFNELFGVQSAKANPAVTIAIGESAVLRQT